MFLLFDTHTVGCFSFTHVLQSCMPTRIHRKNQPAEKKKHSDIYKGYIYGVIYYIYIYIYIYKHAPASISNRGVQQVLIPPSIHLVVNLVLVLQQVLQHTRQEDAATGVSNATQVGLGIWRQIWQFRLDFSHISSLLGRRTDISADLPTLPASSYSMIKVCTVAGKVARWRVLLHDSGQG